MRCILTLTLLVVLGNSARAEELAWHTDYLQARNLAQSQQKPLLIHVGSESCLPCKKMLATTYPDANLTALLGRQFEVLLVDAEKETVLTQALLIKQLPTVLIASPDGIVVHVIEGAVDAAQMKQHLHWAQTRVVAHQQLQVQRYEAARQAQLMQMSGVASPTYPYQQRTSANYPSYPGQATPQTWSAYASPAWGQYPSTLNASTTSSGKRC